MNYDFFIKLLPFIFTLILLISPVYADGVHFSDTYLHLYEPNQKAVIVWNGQTETMILSAAVKSEDISNFAWVIPIQSSSKPEVTAGNISIFEDLVDYFKKKQRNYWGWRALTSGEVEVLESKEIDIYDITILRATDSNELINWLNNNGYKVPEEAKPILDKYVAKGNFYFVANKIDLKNKYQEALNFFENIENERKKSGKTYASFSNYISPVWIYQTSFFLSPNKALEILTMDILEGERVTTIGKHLSPEFLFFSKEDYEFLLNKYNSTDKNYDDIKKDVKEIMDSELEKINLTQLNIYAKELHDVYQKLENGVSTPLKFEFQPEEPYYPLEISSLNLGRGVIEVYVLANGWVTDKNNILKSKESKWINFELKKKLKKYIDLGYSSYVTRLSYNGDLKNLNNDAVFESIYTEKYNLLKIILDWLYNLFTSIFR